MHKIPLILFLSINIICCFFKRKGDLMVYSSDACWAKASHPYSIKLNWEPAARQRQKIIVNRIWSPFFFLPLQIASFACIAVKSSPPLPFSPSWQMQYISRNYGKISLVSEKGGIYLAPSHGGRRRRVTTVVSVSTKQVKDLPHVHLELSL